MNVKKKLIEVALPLEAINRASAREKSIRHGHPSTLHLWWARRPLAACRAVLFASLVDDPSSHPERFPTEEAQEKERERLFRLIEELVKWENSNNEEVLARARQEILNSTDGNPPPVYDPFCGGGSIPLEAQRLGLKAYASDLNPVAVLITKAMIEIPPKFTDRPPVHPNQEPELIAKTVEESGGPGRGHPLLRPVDARRGLPPHRPPVSHGATSGGSRRRRSHRDRLAVGAHGHVPQPRLPGGDASGAVIRAFQEETTRRLGWNRKWITRPIRLRSTSRYAREAAVRRRAPWAVVGATCVVCGTPVPWSMCVPRAGASGSVHA